MPGFVMVGVDDEGNPTGLAVTDQLLRQLADMKTDGNIVPPPSMTVEKQSLNDGDVAIITVQPSDSPPTRYRGRIHIRIGARRGIATAQDERILTEKRRYRDKPFDIQPVPSATLADLSISYFRQEYLAAAINPEILAANERSIEEQLAATKMIASPEDPTPTVLGLLVVGSRSLDFLPGAYVQFLRLAGVELSDQIVDEEKIGGNVAEVLRRTEDKLISHNRSIVDVESSLTERRTETYPIAALRQIVANAIMHRSYDANNAPTHVYWYDDRIEVLSVGGVYGTVTVDNFGQPGLTAYRNPNLAEALRNLGYVQQFGVGIPLARQLLREAGHPDLEFSADANNVLATIHTRR